MSCCDEMSSFVRMRIGVGVYVLSQNTEIFFRLMDYSFENASDKRVCLLGTNEMTRKI